jgi:hypothetical protein
LPRSVEDAPHLRRRTRKFAGEFRNGLRMRPFSRAVPPLDMAAQSAISKSQVPARANDSSAQPATPCRRASARSVPVWLRVERVASELTARRHRIVVVFNIVAERSHTCRGATRRAPACSWPLAVLYGRWALGREPSSASRSGNCPMRSNEADAGNSLIRSVLAVFGTRGSRCWIVW